MAGTQAQILQPQARQVFKVLKEWKISNPKLFQMSQASDEIEIRRRADGEATIQPQFLELGEILPAGLILAALLFIGLWPRGISDRINNEIGSRYERVDYVGLSQFTPACCLIEPGGEDSNQSSSNEGDEPTVEPLSPTTDH